MTTKQGNIFVKFQVNQKQFQTRVAAALLTVAGLFCAAPGTSAQVNPPATSAVNLYPAGVAFFDQFIGTIGPVADRNSDEQRHCGSEHYEDCGQRGILADQQLRNISGCRCVMHDLDPI